MLDEFIWGKVSRISPEAPVPVVEVLKESYHAGGAANVGAVMGRVMPEFKGRADGNTINAIVREELQARG